MNLYKYASPATFYPVAGKMIPWFAIPAAILFVAGMYIGFFIAPTDFQQGDAYRIIFIHVPAAWMGMFLYVLMAIYAGIGWAFNARLSSMMASAIAITGAMFTLVFGLWLLDVLVRQVNGISYGDYFGTDRGKTIALGMALGIIMWFNVWFVIWPAQQVVIASAKQAARGGQAIPEAAARGQRSGFASRTNTLLSIPMLYFMGAASHLPWLGQPTFGTKIGMLVLLLIMAAAFAVCKFPISRVRLSDSSRSRWRRTIRSSRRAVLKFMLRRSKRLLTRLASSNEMPSSTRVLRTSKRRPAISLGSSSSRFFVRRSRFRLCICARR